MKVSLKNGGQETASDDDYIEEEGEARTMLLMDKEVSGTRWKYICLALSMFACVAGGVVGVCLMAQHKGPQPDAAKWKEAAKRPGTSLYCFAFMLPFGNEPYLLKNAANHNTSVFQCDAYDVFSTEVIDLGANQTTVVILPGPKNETSPYCKMNTWTWKNDALALNTEVFIRVWRTVIKMGKYKDFDWIVKLDPDTVFFPHRLRELLAIRHVYPTPEAASWEDCGNCSGRAGDSCADHVKFVQHQDRSCADALKVVRDPNDCGCNCSAKACHSPGNIYFKNCDTNRDYPGGPVHPALHGPITLLSKEAVDTLANGGLNTCEKDLKWSFKNYGEDWFTEHCLLSLQVNPVNEFSLMKDSACGDHDFWCTSAKVAFQPYKSVEQYNKCMNKATELDNWPPHV